MKRSTYTNLQILGEKVLVQFIMHRQLHTAKGLVIRKDRNVLVVKTEEREQPIFHGGIINVHRL